MGEGGREKKIVDVRENAMAARSVRGRKKGIPFLFSGVPLYSHDSLPPCNLVPRAFPSENGRGAYGSSHFLRVKPWERGCPPKHLPHILPSRVLVPSIHSEARTFVSKLNKSKNHKNGLRAEAFFSFGFVAPTKEI